MEIINFRSFRIEKGESNVRGQMRPNMRVFKSTPKGKYSKEKQIMGYYYGTIERRDQALNEFMANIERQERERLEEKQKRADIIANFVNPYKVGDIFYDSWGYEQTNIDFYQVIEVKEKSVVIRSIGQNLVEAIGWASETVTAKKDDFVGEPQLKKIQFLKDGTPYIKSRHGWISPWNGQPKHQSHYA